MRFIQAEFRLNFRAVMILLLPLVFLLQACSSRPRFTDTPSTTVRTAKVKKSVESSEPEGNYRVGQTITGVASYYGDDFHGKETASGETYDMNGMTAAHKSLPFGTVVRVTNPANNRSVVVRINDRGPFVAGRILDLTEEAAKRLELIGKGYGEVEITILTLGSP